ncbi:MAG: GNAT family N-acetyltransferase [Methanocorpusculum parvum]|nr:GNAT family N-acetyltransferase [Methanocorpusculum parvum]
MSFFKSLKEIRQKYIITETVFYSCLPLVKIVKEDEKIYYISPSRLLSESSSSNYKNLWASISFQLLLKDIKKKDYLGVVSKFDSEEKEIRNYLISEAYQNKDEDTYLVFWKRKLVGYFSLKKITDEDGIAIIKIRALGRDSRYIGCGVGKQIINFILIAIQKINKEDTKYNYLTTDVKWGAKRFYDRYGFIIDEQASNDDEVITLWLKVNDTDLENTETTGEHHGCLKRLIIKSVNYLCFPWKHICQKKRGIWRRIKSIIVTTFIPVLIAVIIFILLNLFLQYIHL